ncbi:MAG: apolipoprotein N-acyltransferase [Alphaproteobacteria bacterium]|nr:apolipoprotein N-acyltransferase [Alphaproteobacteria bacterium]
MGGAIGRRLQTAYSTWPGLTLFLAGALLTLGFAPYHLWPVLFVSLPLLYRQLTTSTRYRQAALRAFFFGYGYSMAGTWWIANALLVDADKFAWLLPFSVLGLSAVMALWFVLLGVLVHRLRARMDILLFAVLWVLVEYLRSLGMFGFPWNLVGYMSLAALPLAQLAALIGTYGLSFLLVLLGLLPVVWSGGMGCKNKWRLTICVALLLGLVYGYGLSRLQTPTAFTDTLLRVVQPNIPQAVKGTRAGQAVAIEALGQLTAAPSATGAVPDVTIWPETAYPFTLRAGGTHALPPVKLLLTGAVRAEGYAPEVKIWNSLVAMDGEGHILATYDKHQLVPFGEFVPLRHVLPLAKITPGDLDFSRGQGPRTLAVGRLPPFSPLVCYEAIFPWMAVDSAAPRPAWLLNVTNDGWYGDSAGPYQHFEMARMRAIEQGVPLVRAANSGISAVVDGYGRVVRALKLHERGVMDVYLPAMVANNAYSDYSQFIILCIFALSLFMHIIAYNRRQI